MAVKKEDRRVQYTKMVLKQTLITLLGQKAIDKITVRELCERADINRSTFYAHFKDSCDLLRQIEDELMSEVHIHLKKLRFIDGETESYHRLKIIFEYIVENADLCRALLGEYGDIAFQKEVMMVIQEQRMNEWTSSDVDAELVEYVTLFGIHGSVGVIQKWLQSGMQKSASEMAEFIIKLTYQGLSPYKDTTQMREKAQKV